MVRKITATALAERKKDGAVVREKHNDFNRVMLRVEQLLTKQKKSEEQILKAVSELRQAVLEGGSVDTDKVAAMLSELKQRIPNSHSGGWEFTPHRNRDGYITKVVAAPCQ